MNVINLEDINRYHRRYKLIENGTIRKDGRRWDGSTWRKVGINHHLNEEGLVYYKRKYRTLTGYLQQGGKINILLFKISQNCQNRQK